MVYIPEATQFLMYFEHDVVQMDLDNFYLSSPDTAVQHASKLLIKAQGREFLDAKYFTANDLPDIPVHFDFMACPRSVSDLSSMIGLGHMGPVVRRIVRSAYFPVLNPSPVYKEWQSIAAFFGGSANAARSLRLSMRFARKTGLPLEVFTQEEKAHRDTYEKVIQKEGLEEDMKSLVTKWHRFKAGRFEENVYNVPHDALVVLGAYGHGLISELLFGCKMEVIQSTLSNSLLVVGPGYRLKV